MTDAPAPAATLLPHAMIDIETMATHSSEALILSIGAVPFDLTPTGPVMGEPLLILPSLSAQIAAGRRVERGTQDWWRGRSHAAREHWLNKPATHTPAELAEALRGWLDQHTVPKREIWANGVVFDIGNLDNTLIAEGTKAPWYYNSVRDYRTVIKLLPKLRDAPPMDLPADAHDPVHDCIKQIRTLWEHATPAMLGEAPAAA